MNRKMKVPKAKLPIIVGLIYLILFIVQRDKAIAAFNNSLYYLVEMVEILPVIFLLTMSIEVLVPKEWIMKKFGNDSGIVGNILSLVLGSISAGPIYAAFPITKMLLNKGASVTNIVIILSAWAVVKVPMLANEAKFLGPSFMAVRWLLTVIMIFIMAWLMGRMVKREDVIIKDESHKQPSELPVINHDYCIGCGICAKLVPEIYTMNGKKAEVIKNSDISQYNENIKKSVEKCPVSAIQYESED